MECIDENLHSCCVVSKVAMPENGQITSSSTPHISMKVSMFLLSMANNFLFLWMSILSFFLCHKKNMPELSVVNKFANLEYNSRARKAVTNWESLFANSLYFDSSLHLRNRKFLHRTLLLCKIKNTIFTFCATPTLGTQYWKSTRTTALKKKFQPMQCVVL